MYFWYSLLYLIGRTTFVFLVTSSINDAANYPIKFVRQRRTSEWCVEVDIFRVTLIILKVPNGRKYDVQVSCR